MTIDETCTRIEDFFQEVRAAALPGVWMRDRIVKPHSDGELGDLRKLEPSVPLDVIAFLRRGLRGAEGSIDAGDYSASIGFDFIDVPHIIEHTTMLRDIAATVIGDDRDHPCWPHAVLVCSGVSVSYSEPNLFVTPDGVYHFSYRNPVLRVGTSFGAFLVDYLASGCFAAGSTPATEALEPHIAYRVKKNAWLDAYGGTY